MLENKIIEILNKILDPYVDGLDPDKLKLSNLLTGKVVLNNLNIKPTLIDLLELPFHLTFGSIGTMSLKIHIPILTLSKKKFSVEIQDLIILLTMIPESQWNCEAYRDTYIASKIATLASESLQLVVNEIKGSSFLWNFILSFMETLEIMISNIHIRLEDLTTNPKYPYAFGIDIKKAYMHTNLKKIHVGNNAKGITSVILPFQSLFYNDHDKPSPGIIYRTIDLEGLGLYIDQLDQLSPSLMTYSCTDVNNKHVFTTIDINNDLNSDITDHNSDNASSNTDESAYLDAISYNVVYNPTSRRESINYNNFDNNKLLKRTVYKFRHNNKYRRLPYVNKGKISEMNFNNNQRIGSLHAIEHTNVYHLTVFSHIFDFLSKESHMNNCDNDHKHYNVWSRLNYLNSNNKRRNNEHKSNNVYNTGLYTYKNYRRNYLYTSKKPRKRINLNKSRYKQNRFRNVDNSFVLDWKVNVPKMWIGNPFIESNYGTFKNSTEMNLGYSFSPSSSWRLFLGTFCSVHRHKIPKYTQAYDIIDKSINRSIIRREKNKSKSDNKLDIPNFLSTPKQSDNDEDVKQMCPNILTPCINIDCNSSLSVYDNIDSDDFVNNQSLLHYGPDWHIHDKYPSNLNEIDHVMISNSSKYPTFVNDNSKSVMNESWTRFSFIANNDNLEMLEFFIKTLDEIDHNYLVAPKDFKGIASFYFCSYPITPTKQFKSCWSLWGEKYGRVHSDSTDKYLPQCSVFLVVDDTDIIITKNQVDCLINLIYENIYKYYYWISGVISIFETPRASIDDEKSYMEYWPQYVLLGNELGDDDIRDFVSDFEILHSIQTIRILRNKASVALRNLITSMGSDTKLCPLGADLNTCITDALFSNVFEMYCMNNQHLDIVSDESTVLKDRLQFVGGIYEIVSKHSNSLIITSLRKMCEQKVFMVDLVFDLFIFNSRFIITDSTSKTTNTSGVIGYLASIHGFHYLFQDTYGRDGAQIMEIELLPFSIMSISFSVNPSSKMFSKMNCACKILNSPPSILVTCGDVDININEEKVFKKRDLLNILRKDNKITSDKNKYSSESRPISLISTDAVLYISLDYTHYSIPDRSDVYLRFHLSSDLFVHFRFIDEINHLFQVLKYNLQHYSCHIPIFTTSENNGYYNIRDRSYDECALTYQFIDLGVEFQRAIIRDMAPCFTYNILIDTQSPIVILLDLNLKNTSFTYYVSFGSISMKYEEPNPNDDLYYCHLLRFSNLHIFTYMNNTKYIKDDRMIYIGLRHSISFKKYLHAISNDDIYIDPMISRMLTKFDKNINIIKMDDDNDIIIRTKILKVNTSIETEYCVISYQLGSLYITIRDVDIITFIYTYGKFIDVYNDYLYSYSLYHNNMLNLKYTPNVSTVYTLYDNISSSANEHNNIVTYKWNKLQTMLLEQKLCKNTNVKIILNIDYICINLRRLIELCDVRNKTSSRHATTIIRSDSGNYIKSPSSLLSNDKSLFYTGIDVVNSISSSSLMMRDDSAFSNNSSNVPSNSRINSSVYNNSDFEEPKIKSFSNDELYLLGLALKFYGITQPLVSLKITSFGLMLGLSDIGIKKIRSHLGSLEIEDQSNSVPLYISNIFSGGDDIMFWRWLKVKRELNFVKDNLDIFKLKITHKKTGFITYKSHTDFRSLYHIDIYNTDIDCLIKDDNACVFKSNTNIVSGYNKVKMYLDTVMDYETVVDDSVINVASYFGKSIPCFITCSLNFNDYGIRDLFLYISSCCLNIHWEIIDEFIYYFSRILKYTAFIPEHKDNEIDSNLSGLTPKFKYQPHSSDVDSEFNMSVHISKSNINILTDSSWYGYPNYIKYIWFKLLRDKFNVIDISFYDSRKTTILESTDSVKGSNHPLIIRKPDSIRNNYSSRIGTIDHNIEFYSIKRGITEKSINDLQTNFKYSSNLLWSFIRAIFNERYTRAYISFPTAMRISGICSVYLKYKYCPSALGVSCSRFTNSNKNAPVDMNDNIKSNSLLSHYIPCTLQLSVINRYVSIKLSQDASPLILSSRGYSHVDLPFNITKSFIQRQSEFAKFIRLQHLRDKRYYGLLELSKGTLYDQSYFISDIVEPFRFNFFTTLYIYGYDPNSSNNKLMSQSLSSHLTIEPINITLDFVDLIYIIELCSLFLKSKEFIFDDNVDYSHVSNDLFISKPMGLNSIRYGKSAIVDDEFHSCGSDESEDWMSSSTADINDLDIILQTNIDSNFNIRNRQGSILQSIDDSKPIDIGNLINDILSILSIGLQIDLELINIVISTKIPGDIYHAFNVSLEDIQLALWINNIHNPEFNNASNDYNLNGSIPWEHIISKISLNKICTKNVLYIEVEDYEINDHIDNCMQLDIINNNSKIDNDTCYNLTNSSCDLELPVGMLSNNGFQYYCRGYFTLDLCRGTNKEMVIETINILIDGYKPNIYIKTISNINVSWINLNINLNLGDCYFNFLCYFFDMINLRKIFLENANSEYYSLQPVSICGLHEQINTTMLPFNMISNESQSLLRDYYPHNLSITHINNDTDLLKCLEYRYLNFLFSRRNVLNIYGTLLGVLRNIISSNLISRHKETFDIYDGNMKRIDKEYLSGDYKEHFSALYNNLGQPIAICTNIDLSNYELNWKILQDGEHCILPSGHYGIISPFVVRIQLNNYVYEIPSSSINISHNDEVMFKLDTSQRYIKTKRARFSKVKNNEYNNTQYLFGIPLSKNDGINIDVNDTISSNTNIGSINFKNINVEFKGDNNSYRFVYIIVKTIQHLSLQSNSNSGQSSINIYLSSPISITNKTRENIVVFPCTNLSTSAGNRLLDISSMVCLDFPNPPTYNIPLSPKSLNSKGLVSREYITNTIFKQIININESRAIRKLIPTHILESTNIAYAYSNTKLQHLVVKGNLFNPNKISLPISWIYEESCSIYISLEDDFPLSLNHSNINTSRLSSIHSVGKSSTVFKVNSIERQCIFADILMSRQMIDVIYESLDTQKLRIPVPGYIPYVNLGNAESYINHQQSGEQITRNHVKTVSELNIFDNKSSSQINLPDRDISSRHLSDPYYTNTDVSGVVGNLLHALSKPFSSKSVSKVDKYQSNLNTFISIDSVKENLSSSFPPSVVLSSALVELTSHFKSTHPRLNPLKYTLKQYEIILESCQIIENMMPLDLYFISTKTFEYLNPKFDSVLTEQPSNDEPLLVKGGCSIQLSSYMKSGRFVIKDLISNEIEFKLYEYESSNTVSVLFEIMQPGLLNSTMKYIFNDRNIIGENEFRSLPRRMLLSIDIRKKSIDPIKDKSGYIKRIIDSSQVVCTIYADKWVVNWLDYPISICRFDGRFQQTIGARSCTIVSMDLSSSQLQLAIWKPNLKSIHNFDIYNKRKKRRLFDFRNSDGSHVMSSKFIIPDLTFSTCSFKNSIEHPYLHYLISNCMAPIPFFRTGVLEILPQIIITNDINDVVWIRESYKYGKNVSRRIENPWHRVDSGITVEFHSQMKGEFYIDVTGIDPSRFLSSNVSKYHDNNLTSPLNFMSINSPLSRIKSSTPLNQWSCSMALKSSSLIQFRYPVDLINTYNSQSTTSYDYHIKYAICEIETQLHRGAKLIRFTTPNSPDWVILNSTGLDLWVEQYGVDGYGEIINFIQHSSDFSRHYSNNASSFSWYDPFKDQKLACKLHYLQMLSLTDFTSSNVMFKRYKPNMKGSLFNRKSCKINDRRELCHVKIKGSLIIDLSSVRSVHNAAVFRLQYGRYKMNLKLTAQSSIMFGQRTLHIMATRLSTKMGFDFKYLRGDNLFELYHKIRKRVMIYKPSGILRVAKSEKKEKSVKLFRNKTSNKSIDDANINYSDRKKKSSNYKKPSSLTINSNAFNFNYSINTKILGLGISLCSYIPDELSYISCTLIKINLDIENDEIKRHFSLGWIQSDIHDRSTCFPTMIRPIHNYSVYYNRSNFKPDEINNLGLNQPDVLSIIFNTRSNKYIDLKEITMFNLDLQPISINIDTRIILSFLYLIDEYLDVFGFGSTTYDYFITPKIGNIAHNNNQEFELAQYPLHEYARSRYTCSLYSTTKYNISKLQIGKVVMVINIRRSGALSIMDSPPVNPMIRYLVYIVRRTPYISDAHISLARESFLRTCCTPYVLISHFINRYITQGVQQIYKVLWAVDLIGNPKIVFNHCISGVLQTFSDIRDALRFIHLPPMTFFLILKGISSLIISVFSGIIDALYRATGSWYLLFNTLSCNTDRYSVLIMHDVFRKSPSEPCNIIDGFIYAGSSIGKNLYISLGNFALKPIYSINKFIHCINSEHSTTRDVAISGINIFGSIFSSLSSFVFGVTSSLLSGVSLVLQGLLNQIHNVPMVTAVRPRRSMQLLKTPGSTRYNFIESWSMDISNKIEELDDVLLVLPLDLKNRLFDPTYLVMSHWSVLTKDIDHINPLILVQSFSKFNKLFWIDRVRIGYIENNRIRWRFENNDILSIELYIISPEYSLYDDASVETSYIRNDGTVVLNVNNKIAKKYFHGNDLYYLRIVHAGTSISTSIKYENKIPRDIQNKLFSNIEVPSKKSKNFVDIGQINNIYTSQILVTPTDKRDVVYNEHNATDNIINNNIIIVEDKTTNADDLFTCSLVDGSDIAVSIDENKNYNNTFDELMKSGSIGQQIVNKIIKNQNVEHDAEIITMTNLETARLYFTLLVSVLNGAEI